jgi:glucosamine--fructose-6-phosphate aminotransferase (isomerizing)
MESDINCHPQRSETSNEFGVHNGILTNYNDIKSLPQKHGYVFETEIVTEVIPKLIHYLYQTHHDDKPSLSFRELVMLTVGQMLLS